MEITRAFQKMNVFNPIPGSGLARSRPRTSRWGESSKIPCSKSRTTPTFIQLADCVAFSLLKREVAPTSLVKKYGIHRMFEKNIGRVCFRLAAPKDALGIVRK